MRALAVIDGEHYPDVVRRALAELPFEIYITTNYDNFMVEALRARDRDPCRVVCQWNAAVEESDMSRAPSPASPVNSGLGPNRCVIGSSKPRSTAASVRA